MSTVSLKHIVQKRGVEFIKKTNFRKNDKKEKQGFENNYSDRIFSLTLFIQVSHDFHQLHLSISFYPVRHLINI